MSTLKTKLAEKVEVIESQNMDSNGYINDTRSHSQSSENLIILRPQDNNQNISPISDSAVSINEVKLRISLLQSFVKEIMILGIDYGPIPNGGGKFTLFKSGAERLADMFSLTKQFEVINRIEDWDKALFHYEIKVILINKRTGYIESEGIGCCNNRERKYKSQDGYSLINTIIKMAKKRALVDAVLSATSSSGIFSQDIPDEDTDTTNYEQPPNNLSTQTTNTTKNKNIINTTKPTDTNKTSSISLISKSQQTKILSIINQRKLPIEEIRNVMNERYKITESKNLNIAQADDFIEFLKSYNSI